MTDPQKGPSLGDGNWLRDRSSRWRARGLIGLALVVALVVGALAVRVGGGDDRSVPTLYRGPGAGASDSAAVAPATTTPGPTAEPAADSGAIPGPGPAAVTPPEPAARGTGVAPADSAGPGPGSRPDPDPESDPNPNPNPDPDSVYVPPTPPDGWAAADSPSPRTLAPVADSLRVPRPEAVRGIYVGSWSAGDRRRLASLLELADATEINAFVVDIKDVTGEVSYRTEVPLAVQVEADRRIRIPDVTALLDSLRAHGVYPIARIVAFKDPLLAVARPEWSVLRITGAPWEDDNGVRWVDSFNRHVWDYNIELAREAVALGFAEVQWDYVRFPDVPESYTVEAIYPSREGRTKTEAIREFLGYSADRLPDDVPVTADVFGITTSTRRDIGIGQVWEAMTDRVDVLLPMVYPSHYPDGSWGFANPNAAPYQIVKRALDAGVARSDTLEDAAAIRPWLQAFSLGEPAYGPRHIRAQIDAAYDAGIREWVLWHPGVRYPIEAFTDANGIEPWFAGMGEALYEPPAGDDAAPAGDTAAGGG